MYQGRPCRAPVFNYGVDFDEHDANAQGYYYVVVCGKIPGIYLDVQQAQVQTLRFLNGKMKREDTFQLAEAFWAEWCRRSHDHTQYKVKGLAKTFNTYDDALEAATGLITQI
ncbi:hypothetical protein B0H11DRAFT_2255636 [Mycena galericulata]|nr:hypothetical protein B0H11DRAFT_2255636 [Mycena galericulata]